MHVLMLGWEFPPFITGGLGTACFGLTKAMDRRGMQVTFIVPKSIEVSHASHVRLLAPLTEMPESPATVGAPSPKAMESERERSTPGPSHPSESLGIGDVLEGTQLTPYAREGFKHVRFIEIPAAFASPYEHWPAQIGHPQHATEPSEDTRRPADFKHAGLNAPREVASRHNVDPVNQQPLRDEVGEAGGQARAETAIGAQSRGDYGGDIFSQVERYAYFVLGATRHLEIDVIHAHDWMTYPAGILLARVTGKPLVAHIHSTEFDRAGEHGNQRICDIERRGLQTAMRVIAVSQLTKNIVVAEYGVPEQRVDVVYNGVDLEPDQVGITGIRSKDKIVLYFGRITHQKGPEYFIRAAKRVLEVMDEVKFVVAGSGDMAKRMIEMASELGIGNKVLFTGFLRGQDITRVFNLADLYVMPSVSEPFGIAPLEAMSHNVPVLISKSSGVSEVLQHVLKVDFWDVDDMANKIVAVLRHPPLHQTLREHGAFEARRLTWDGAAERCSQVYAEVISDMTPQPR